MARQGGNYGNLVVHFKDINDTLKSSDSETLSLKSSKASLLGLALPKNQSPTSKKSLTNFMSVITPIVNMAFSQSGCVCIQPL